jgi:hypothetical protein
MQNVCKELKGFAISFMSCLNTMCNLEIRIVALRHYAQWRLENIVHVIIKMMFDVHARKKSLEALCFDPLYLHTYKLTLVSPLKKFYISIIWVKCYVIQFET